MKALPLPSPFPQSNSNVAHTTLDLVLFSSYQTLSANKEDSMSGVWVFKNGVYRLENPGAPHGRSGGGSRQKVLVYTPTGEVITSHAMLEPKLTALGWERYLNDPDLLQFHQRSSVHLISLPRDFSKMKSMHMYDIVVKTRNIFEVRDA